MSSLDPGSASAPANGTAGVRPLTTPALSATALLQVLRHRWLTAATLAAGVALTAATAVWLGMPRPKNVYSATALVHIAPHPRQNDMYSYQVFQRTQVELCKRRSVLDAALQEPQAAELASVRANPDGVVHWLASDLKADLGNGDRPTQILRLSLTGEVPNDVVVLLNATKEAYLREVADQARAERESRIAFHETSYKDLQQQLGESREALQRAATDGGALLAEKERQAQSLLSEYQKELARAEASRIKASVRAAALKKVPRPASPGDITPAGNPTGGPPREDVIKGVVESELGKEYDVQGYRKRLTAVEQAMASIESITTRPSGLEEYREYQEEQRSLLDKIDKRRRVLRPLVEDQMRAATAPGGVAYAADAVTQAEEDLKLIQAEYDELSGKVAQQARALNTLEVARSRAAMEQVEAMSQKKKDVDRLDKLSASVLDQLEAARLELKQPPRVTSVQDAQEAELVPSKDPYRELKAAGVTGAGAFFLVAFGVAWWEFRARRIYAGRDVARQAGLRVLGTLPALPERLARAPAATGAPALTEAADALRALLLHDVGAGGGRVFLVTSALPQEGKTFLACQLAASLARAGKRTLLVDADLAHPCLAQAFELPPGPGLSDVLLGRSKADEAARPTRIDGLSVLPAGPPDPGTVQALGRDAAGPLFGALRADYDAVVVDSGPVLPAVNSLLLGKHADGVVLAALREVSRVPPLHAAHQRLAAMGIRVLGAVFLGAPEGAYGDSYDAEPLAA
jgi:capsular exopolysaccharide synthesis family protein